MQRKISKIAISGTAILCLLFTIAFARELIPVGRTVGVKMHAEGVIVAAVETVQTSQGTQAPAQDAGLQVGDLIVEINGKQTLCNDDLQKSIALSAGKILKMQVIREEQTVLLQATAVEDVNGTYKLGLLVRDGIAGIGTVTYVDPETGAYGALGHGVCDSETGALLPMQIGSLMESSVASVIAGASGAPGSLQGEFDLEHDMGSVDSNTETGIFGTLSEDDYYEDLAPMEVATADQVTVGTCQILSNVQGEQVQYYDAEILQILQDNTSTALVIQITDPELLAITGGIVQGMSGSPIIQNGLFVGAVTHVLVSDSTRGYGILVEDMLETAETMI